MRKCACPFATALLLVALLLSVGDNVSAAEAVQNISSNTYLAALGPRATLEGYSANKGEPPSTGWTPGNLGKAWVEGEWVPYQLILEAIDPGLAGLDSIVISFDFMKSGDRFVDLVRGIQVGTTARTGNQGWPAPDGSALPTTTMAELKAAQNGVSENAWTGFTLLGLPNEQINRTLTGGLDVPPGQDRHMFKIYKSDLLAAGIDPNAPTVVIYFQLHVSRTFVWNNVLQAGYDISPTDDWGGYLYSTDGWPTAAPVLGSGFVPGSSGHIGLEVPGGGKTVPIPIPEALPGVVSGTKWDDVNRDGNMDPGELPLEGWRIHVSGNVESIDFTTSMLTDAAGLYLFSDLTSGTVWTIKEASQREVPGEAGYAQTYPPIGEVVGQGTAIAVSPPPPDAAGVGWSVELTSEIFEQYDLDFGNARCQLAITCPDDITIYCTDSTDPSFTGEPTVVGGCPPFDVTYTDQSDGQICPETITRTWRATDNVGNSAECVQLIMIDDDVPPVITCPGAVQVQCPADIPAPDIGSVTASDDCCTPAVTWEGDVSDGNTCPEIITRTYRATDDCGNTAECTQLITIDDTTPPTITCPDDVAIECDEVVPEPNIGSVSASDNCGTPTVTWEGDVSDGNTCPEIITRTYRATDDCGNTAECTQLITIDDTTPPTITCPGNVAVQCAEDVPEPDIGSVTAGDNCPPVVVTWISDVPDGAVCPLTITRTYRATDGCGNTAECTQLITVNDTEPPTITCPDDIAISCTDPIPAPDIGDVTAGDNCGTPTVTWEGDVSDGNTCPETIARTYRATDGCGNTAECTQLITIDDEEPPTITCPGNIAVQCPDDVPAPDPGSVVASDDCGPPTVEWVGDSTDEGSCPEVITRTYRATDGCGNTAECTQLITIDDTIAPTLVCAPDGRAACNGTVTFTDPAVSDNCDPAPSLEIVSTVEEPGPGECEMTHTRTWRATDYCGNTSECSQSIVRVVDTDAPVLTPAPDATLECNQPVVFPDPAVSDNCDPEPEVVGLDPIITYDSRTCMETQTKCWIATDDCGNSASACQTLMRMVDTEPPVLTCAPDKEIEEGDSVIFDEPTVTDNCTAGPPQAGEITVTDDPENYMRTYTRCWTAADLCLNLSEPCCQTIIERLAPPPYCTFRCWNWVADCLPEPNRDMSTLPACIRDDYFYDLFPGGVTIGIDGPSGYSILLTSPQAVEEFGCSYGISRVLTRDYVDPKRYELRGVLAGEIMALRFNREYSCSGYFEGIGYPAMESCYGNYVIPDTTDPSNSVRRFAGLTVDQFLALADQTIGGNPDVLIPYGANIDHLWETAAWLNNRFSDCGGLVESGPSVGDVERRLHSTEEDVEEVASKLLPEVFSIGLQPNPLHGSTTIALALPVAGNVSVEIFDVRGRRVKTLVDEARSAGYHDIVWYGRDASGSVVGSGVYFCRVKIDGESVALEKMIKL